MLPRVCSITKNEVASWLKLRVIESEAADVVSPRAANFFDRAGKSSYAGRSPGASTDVKEIDENLESYHEARAVRQSVDGEAFAARRVRNRVRMSSSSSTSSDRPFKSVSHSQPTGTPSIASCSARHVAVTTVEQRLDFLEKRSEAQRKLEESSIKRYEALRRRVDTLEYKLGCQSSSSVQSVAAAEMQDFPVMRSCSMQPIGSVNWIMESYPTTADAIIGMLHHLQVDEADWPLIFSVRDRPEDELPKRLMHARFTEEQLALFCMGKPNMSRERGPDGRPIRDAAGNLLPSKLTVLPDVDVMNRK